MLTGYFQAIRFLIGMNWRKPQSTIVVEALKLQGDDGSEKVADFYRPKCSSSKGLIIFYHGMNKYGRRDPRVQDACDVLRNLGYSVVAPEIDAVRELCITEKALNEIIEVTRRIKHHAELKQFKKVGLFAASYTTAGAMYAITQDDLKDFPTVMLSLGGCFIPLNSFVKLLSREVTDPYATAITILNFLPGEDRQDEKVMKGLWLMTVDAYHNKSYEKIDTYLKSAELTEKQRRRISYWLNEIINPSDLYLEEGFKARYTGASERIMKFFNEQNLKTPFVLIHSPGDSVLNVSETINFKKLLDDKRIPNTMALTQLLDHADIQFKFSYLKDIWHLLKAFAFFFGHL